MQTIVKNLSICLGLLYLGVGCAEKESASIGQRGFSIVAADMFSFENTPILWTSGQSIGISGNASHGQQSLEITGCGWLEVDSPVFPTSQLSAVEDTIRFDLFIPTNQSNQWWIGDVGVYISIPSSGIYHEWFGQQLMNDLARGSWVEVEVALPVHIKAALLENHEDVTLHLGVNTSSCEEPILIDNIRFAEDVVPQSCLSDSDCGNGQYCFFSACDSRPGECTAFPDTCTAIVEPVCGCDGVTYDNDCEAATAGISIDYARECNPLHSDCSDSSDCRYNQYCEKSSCSDSTGTCELKMVCRMREFDEVCGCDGTTYQNPCLANRAGENVDYGGECNPLHATCSVSSECGDDQYCEKSSCSEPTGTCELKMVCRMREFDEVCGCDGTTYQNSCLANRAGENVDYGGECNPLHATCSDSSECGDDQYCEKSSCSEPTGTCELKMVCRMREFDEVCGCDGTTYQNPCLANRAGENVDYGGECNPLHATCSDSSECGDDQYCEKSSCSEPTGTCELKMVCRMREFDEVCGCDGTTYQNPCLANRAGENVDYAGVCGL